MSKKESREIELLRKQLELLAEKSAVISKLSGHESELVNYSRPCQPDCVNISKTKS